MNITRIDIFGAVGGVLIAGVIYSYMVSVKNAAPPTEWFAVKDISVPDFVQGDDPPVIYNRQILKPFYGDWSVEIHGTNESTDYAICAGSGSAYYEPKENLPDTGVSMSWFFGYEAWKGCSLNDGQYVLQTHWKIRPIGYPEKEYSMTSNIFRVLPKGAQLYVTPTQSQQLETTGKIIEKLQEENLP